MSGQMAPRAQAPLDARDLFVEIGPEVKYWRLKLSLFLNFLLFSVLMSSDGILILQVQKHYGVPASTAGLLGGCRDVSVAVAALLLAAYVARIGYKRSMLIALAMAALICAYVPMGNSFATIALLFVITGVAFALIKGAIFSSIALVAHGSRAHASLMSYLEATYACGTFAGYFVFSEYSIEPTGWLRVYYLLTAASILCMVLSWSTPIDESQVAVPRTQPLSADFLAMLRLATTAVAGAFAACIFTYDFLTEGINKWLPTFNNDVLHIPVTLSIQLASITAASAVVGRILGGLAVAVFSWLTVLLTCLLLSALLVLVALGLANHVSAVAVTSWRTAPPAAYLFPLIGMVTAPIYPVINSRVLSSLPPSQHGAMSGLIMLCSAVGATVGAWITGNIFQVYGGTAAFYWTLCPIGLLALGILALYHFERKAARALGA
jgi:MFS transporter, FHS family, glucose/mannose:H+ symporter